METRAAPAKTNRLKQLNTASYLVGQYHFYRGLTYRHITLMLEKQHNITMNQRTLKRRLKDYGLKNFCLRDRGRLGNEGRLISLKIGTQSGYVDLCHMPKFQVQRPSFSQVLDIYKPLRGPQRQIFSVILATFQSLV